MFILMKYHENEIESSMAMCGAYDDRERAVEHMRADYEDVRSRHGADTFEEWERDCIDDVQAELKLDGVPDRWVWAIFDGLSHRCIWF